MITRDDKIAALRREMALRERVYPKWIASGRMKQSKADHELAVMRAILADYQTND